MPFHDLPERIAEIRGRVARAVAAGGHGQTVAIIAVTKTHGPEAVVSALEAGLHDVGENKVQEALSKMEEVTLPARWHLIGHLQRNKVRTLPSFYLLHALDSARLATAVNEQGISQGKPIDVLVQVNVAGEQTKGGYDPAELQAESDRLATLSGIRVRGVMAMAPYEAHEGMLRKVFGGARSARAVLQAAGHPATELSMGMSNDFEIAVEEGATYIRLGTILFGARSA